MTFSSACSPRDGSIEKSPAASSLAARREEEEALLLFFGFDDGEELEEELEEATMPAPPPQGPHPPHETGTPHWLLCRSTSEAIQPLAAA